MGRAVKHAHGRVLPHERLLFQGFASRAADADLSSPCASRVVVRLLSITAAATNGSKKRQRPNLHVKLASRCMRPRQWEEETSLPQKLAKTNSSDNKSPPARATCPDGAVCSSLCWPRWPTDQSGTAVHLHFLISLPPCVYEFHPMLPRSASSMEDLHNVFDGLLLQSLLRAFGHRGCTLCV